MEKNDFALCLLLIMHTVLFISFMITLTTVGRTIQSRKRVSNFILGKIIIAFSR